jgi:glutamate-1-semialdehyde aminotransferase
MHSIGRDEIDSAFRIFKARTKDEIACVLVEIFPEMLTRLPPKRKKWQTEPHRMIIFDAIATGFAYWQRPPPRN